MKFQIKKEIMILVFREFVQFRLKIYLDKHFTSYFQIGFDPSFLLLVKDVHLMDELKKCPFFSHCPWIVED